MHFATSSVDTIATNTGAMPDPASLQFMPVFATTSRTDAGLNAPAAVTAKQTQPITTQPQVGLPALSGPGPFNPAAALSPKVVKRVLELEFVEMSELRADIWTEDLAGSEVGAPARRAPSKPPVTDIKVWLECFARMASLLVTRFPEKGPEMWAYQTTILKAANNYEGGNWVAYDRQYRRDMLARQDLNWSIPNTRLYNEAFTGRAKIIPRCPHCLSEDHTRTNCPHSPNPVLVGWLPDPHQVPPFTTQVHYSLAASQAQREVCRNFNENRCRFTRCQFQHVCLNCWGPHPAISCPRRAGPPGAGQSARGHYSGRGRAGQVHPYVLPQRY